MTDDRLGPQLVVVAAGGALGALARYVVLTAWPAPPGGFPLSTFAVNVAGCLLIGVLMVLVGEARPTHPLVRPFLGVGVLGGFTTFSTYAEEIRVLPAPVAVAYAAGTLVAAVAAVFAGVRLTRAVVRA